PNQRPPSPTPAPPPPAQTSQTAPAQTEPVKTRREALFDAAARTARQELETGRRLRFAVEPEDAVVKIQARGERSIVQGQVIDFEAGEEDARDLELPGDGTYLVTLVHASHPDVVLLVRAEASRASSARVIRLSMAQASRPATGDGVPTIRASRGVFFSGSPAGAVVLVDGENRGQASQFPGGRGLSRARNSMRLARGRHTVRVEAPGHEPQEFQVLIDSGARARFSQILFRLRPSP
ncbi:MAG: hypothetical protein AAF725_25345, partial [Acidobacteriota bacterium]